MPELGPHWTGGISGLMLGVTLATTLHAQASEKVVVDGSTGVMPLVAALAKAYQERNPAATVEIGKGLGTKARLQALADGKIDIALASHGLVAEELTRQGMAVHEIAIAPRTRPDSEVDAEVVRGKVACLANPKMPEGVKVMPRSGDMAKELAVTVGAIGMTTTTVVEQNRGQIKLLSLNGVFPSAENVERKSYTLTRDSFLVTKAPPLPPCPGSSSLFAVPQAPPSSSPTVRCR